MRLILVFVRMAVNNVGRNWNRTGMIILSMMVASALMTLTLALSSGYPDSAHLSYRRMVGADILVYPNLFVFAGAGADVEAWELRRLDPDLPSDVLFFHPDLTSGYLSPIGAPPPVFDLLNLPTELTDHPGVAGVEPARLLRAHLILEEDGRKIRLPVTIRGRDLEADAGDWRLSEVVVRGRVPQPGHESERVALVSRAAAGSGVVPGGRLVIEVPMIRGHTDDGRPVVDYAEVRSYQFLTYGIFELPAGTVTVKGLEDEGGPVRMQLAVGIDEPEVWIPAGTFDHLYEELSGAPPRYTGQLLVRAENMFRAKDTAAALAEMLPDYTILTVPQEVALAGMRYEATLDKETFKVEVKRLYRSKATAALDVKDGLNVIAFIVAGLLVVANMYILVAQRRRELGVLKAVGASTGDIFVLVLTESLGYSLVGSLIGFVLVRLITLVSLLASSVGFVEGALLTLQTGALVVGVTTAVSLVFGFLPAWEAARTPTATLVKET